MRDENCIFCKIANGEIPSSTVYEDEEFRAILDLGPASKGHTLILPKEHFRDLTELPEDWCGKALFLAGKIGSAMKKELTQGSRQRWISTPQFSEKRPTICLNFVIRTASVSTT